MKTKEQILEHCKNVGHTETARRQIWAYLIGKGIKDKEEEILLKDGESTFDDFLKWENKNNEVFTINPIELNWIYKYFSSLKQLRDDFNYITNEPNQTKPKFKVGDWVRIKNTEYAFGQIVSINCDKKICFTYKVRCSIRNMDIELIRDEDYLVAYYPKEGEFFCVKYNYSLGKSDCIGQRDSIRGEGNYVLHFYYGIGTQDNLLYTNAYTCRNYSILELRPATKEEIQTLKDKVKKACNKEWNGKAWVDIKKSDKELFYEWKCENGFISVHHEGLNTTQSLCIYNKIRAYTELYLFSQWVNQFYDTKECQCYVLYLLNDEINIIKSTNCSCMGEIIFNSKKAVQRAIDYLSEEQIKTALS